MASCAPGQHGALTLLIDDGGEGEAIGVAFELPPAYAAEIRVLAEQSDQTIAEILGQGIAAIMGLSIAGVIAQPEGEAGEEFWETVAR